jgi:hypothetical protein
MQRLEWVQELDNRDMYLTQLIKSFNPKSTTKPTRLESGPALEMREAVMLLQRSERGRQGREAFRLKLVHKKQRQLADKRNRTGLMITHDMAVVKIQSALRGMLWRRRIRREADEVQLQMLALPVSLTVSQVLSPCTSSLRAGELAPRASCGLVSWQLLGDQSDDATGRAITGAHLHWDEAQACEQGL